MRALPFVLTAVTILHTLPASAGSPWDGTWKLDAKSVHIVPSPLRIEQSGPHYTMEQGATYRFDCDGRDFPAGTSGAVRCVRQGRGMEVELRKAGQLASRWTLRVHADGIAMTATATEFPLGVRPAVEREEYVRSGPRSGTAVGSWTGVRTTLEGSDALELRIHDGFLYLRDARDGEASDAKLDGTPGPFVSVGDHTGITWSNVLENEKRIVGHALRNGRALNTEVLELSNDGKSIKASQPESPNHFEAVYEKQ